MHLKTCRERGVSRKVISSIIHCSQETALCLFSAYGSAAVCYVNPDLWLALDTNWYSTLLGRTEVYHAAIYCTCSCQPL